MKNLTNPYQILNYVSGLVCDTHDLINENDTDNIQKNIKEIMDLFNLSYPIFQVTTDNKLFIYQDYCTQNKIDKDLKIINTETGQKATSNLLNHLSLFSTTYVIDKIHNPFEN